LSAASLVIAARPQASRTELSRRAAILAAAILPCLGCDDGRAERVPVSGQVLIDGKPLNYGYVRFVPTGSRPSGGYLDQEGRFTLGCFEKDDGAIPGEHQVEINAGESISSTEWFWHAPKKYRSYRTSGLSQTITEPTDSLVFNLTWDGGKPFRERTR
jgi:hypothetical protein